MTAFQGALADTDETDSVVTKSEAGFPFGIYISAVVTKCVVNCGFGVYAVVTNVTAGGMFGIYAVVTKCRVGAAFDIYVVGDGAHVHAGNNKRSFRFVAQCARKLDRRITFYPPQIGAAALFHVGHLHIIAGRFYEVMSESGVEFGEMGPVFIWLLVRYRTKSASLPRCCLPAMG